MGTAFGRSCLSGLIIAQWPADGGHYPALAHQVSLAAGLGLQLVGLAIFLAPKRHLQPMSTGVAVARTLGVDPCIAATLPAPYAAALSAWRRHVAHARRQAMAWRFAAVASMTLCVGLGGAVSLALVRPAVAFHLISLIFRHPCSREAGSSVERRFRLRHRQLDWTRIFGADDGSEGENGSAEGQAEQSLVQEAQGRFSAARISG
jgi:hypothetical protein